MDTVVITDIEYQELLKIQKKYTALLNKSVIYLSNMNIYCRICNTISKNNGNIINHTFKEETYFKEEIKII